MNHGQRCLVNRLPTELLAHTFHLGSHLLDSPYTPVPFPVLASHVCRLWRNIALSSPSLWTIINFSKFLPYECSKIQIERSKSLPIDITLRLVSFDEDVSTILDIIVPHVMRWRRLEVVVDEDVHLENVLTRLAQCNSAPLLEILVLCHLDVKDFRPKSSLVPFHGNAPRLSYVTLEDVIIGWSSSLLHDLVEFHLENREMDMQPSWADFSRILRESPRLTDLKLSYSGPAEPFTDWQDESIELPSLDNLSLTNKDPIYVSSLFRLLSMPNLKKLTLHLSGGDYSEFVRQLATSRRSVLSGLRYLGIAWMSCDQSSINALYEQLTNLKSIYLNCKFIHKMFFTTLMEPSSGAFHCPNLTTIIIWGIPGQEMRSFITVRAMAGIPIKRIVIRRGFKSDALNEEDEKWLRENSQSFVRSYNVDHIDADVQ